MSSYGFIDNSLIEYPGEIASVVFYSECKAKCPFCYNKGRIGGLFLEDLFKRIERARPYVTGIVLTGGEITESPDFPALLYFAKMKNLRVKVHTNGSNPLVIASFRQYIDRLDMDLKTTPDKYCSNTGILWESVEDTISIFKGENLHFHTTICPKMIIPEEMPKLLKFLDKSWFGSWVFQECTGHGHDEKLNKAPFTDIVKSFKEQ